MLLKPFFLARPALAGVQARQRKACRSYQAKVAAIELTGLVLMGWKRIFLFGNLPKFGSPLRDSFHGLQMDT